MKAGVIGAGRFGRNHVRNLHEMEVLQCVADLDENARKEAEEEFGVPAYADYREMLKEGGPECIVIAAPAEWHHPIAKECMEAGRHCLIEKPMTTNTQDAEELVQLAKDKGVTLMVGHLLIYQPAIQWIKDAIERGVIGKVVSMHQERLNLGRARDQENAAWSLGVHDVAVAVFLMGDKPVETSYSGKAALNEGVDDDSYIHMTFANGAKAHIHSSWLWPELRRHLVIVGEKGMLVFDEPNKRVILHDKGINPENLQNINEGEEEVFHGDGQPLRLELEHFMECCREGKTPRSDGESGLDVIRVLNQASPAS